MKRCIIKNETAVLRLHMAMLETEEYKRLQAHSPHPHTDAKEDIEDRQQQFEMHSLCTPKRDVGEVIGKGRRLAGHAKTFRFHSVCS